MVEISSKVDDVLEKDSITSKALSLVPYSGNLLRYRRLLSKSQWWSRTQQEEYQLLELGRLLDHAYANVPYYKRVFGERGLKPKDIRDFGDLEKLPFLTKEIIRNNLDDLKAKNFPAARFEYVTTGGSSGIPLGFYYDKGKSRAVEWAFIRSLFGRVGYRFNDKCLILKGSIVNTSDLWKYTFFRRWLVLSSYYMTEGNLPGYVDKIRQFKPRYIQGYPSTITMLARYMRAHRVVPFDSIKAVICASENMYPGQRELLEETFQCRVFSFYGHSERVVLAGECEHSTDYHVFPEYGIFEVVREDGAVVKNAGDSGFIVGTGFTNYAMPLIRYKTDDATTLIGGKCKCGREYQRIGKVEGRWLQEFILAKDSRLIPMTAINMHSDLFDNVEQFQFYQDREGEVLLNVVKKAGYTGRDTEYIKKELQKKLGTDVKLDICFVESIERSVRGKHRFLIQKLPVKVTDF